MAAHENPWQGDEQVEREGSLGEQAETRVYAVDGSPCKYRPLYHSSGPLHAPARLRGKRYRQLRVRDGLDGGNGQGVSIKQVHVGARVRATGSETAGPVGLSIVIDLDVGLGLERDEEC